ncbi:MAG: cytochrome P450 [Pseudonocardia sp.]|nr:cytochrome P450 [Pseudonocardia sp.]
MTAVMRVRFNPFDAGFRRDPYPLYHRLRDADPVHRALGMWVLTRHAHVREVLRDREFSAGLIPTQVERRVDAGARIVRLGRASLVFTDNPEHARLRGLVNRAFTGVADLRPVVERATDDLMADAFARDVVDVVADLADPLPVAVLCAWMALPADVAGRVAAWTHDIRFLLEPGLMKDDDVARVTQVVDDFVLALADVITQRRARPGDDLISRLGAARTGGGDRLTDEEVAFVVIMSFVAGHETTTSLIGNALLALLRHPGQAALLRARPQLVASAVREALRYDSPLQMTKRLATRDGEIGGRAIRAGEVILLCLGAANRDPAVFAAPDAFDITRDTTGHVAFGDGLHGCLGGQLAQLQAQVVLEGLARHPRPLRLRSDEPLVWQDHSQIVRGLTRLPVAWGSA